MGVRYWVSSRRPRGRTSYETATGSVGSSSSLVVRPVSTRFLCIVALYRSESGSARRATRRASQRRDALALPARRLGEREAGAASRLPDKGRKMGRGGEPKKPRSTTFFLCGLTPLAFMLCL